MRKQKAKNLMALCMSVKNVPTTIKHWVHVRYSTITARNLTIRYGTYRTHFLSQMFLKEVHKKVRRVPVPGTYLYLIQAHIYLLESILFQSEWKNYGH